MCPVGSYCNSAAENNTETCDGGYYCWKYTQEKYQTPIYPGKYAGASIGNYSNAQNCEVGKYCPIHSSTPVDCPAGTFTSGTGNGEVMNCEDCPAGFYCNTTGSSSSGGACPAAHYCPAGTLDPFSFPCPPGTYVDTNGTTSSSGCTDCPAGSACLERTSTSGTDITISTVTQAVNAILACAAGHYCPVRTELPNQYPCPAGTYTASTSLTASNACTNCPAGKWCDVGSADATTDCPKNFYCPLGTTSPLPCAAGQYSAAGASACTNCPVGSICPEYAENENPQVCPEGYFMENAGSAGPCDLAPEGHYSTGTGAKIACPDGQWSAPGGRNSSVCTNCPVGYYCASGGRTDCGTGKWCPPGSSAPTTCPPGSYCPNSVTTILLVCPAGTYSAANSSSCTDAPAGNYTDQGATDSQTTSQCSTGYYCPAGATGATDMACALNEYSAAGSDAIGDCTTCSAGKYCLRGSAGEVDCPAGFYCPSAQNYPVPCPKGTFRATTGAASVSDCTSCTAGSVCSLTGLTAPNDECDAGYYCPAGTAFSRTVEPADGNAITSNAVLPTGVTRAIECPAGHYCPSGSGTATVCPAGTYNSVNGQRIRGACLSCPAGKYCDGTANTQPDGDCTAGHSCPVGSSSATQNEAPAGSFSGAGASSSTLCYPGTFQNSTGQSSCLPCTAGNYCPGFGSSSETTCTAGNYCPAGSNKPTPCQAGTFSASTGLTAQSGCTACTAGKYCESHGLTAVTGDCAAGYFCEANAISSMPSNDSANYEFGPCKRGHYCPPQTGAANACPNGTYFDGLGADAESDCKPCLPGQYCEGTGNEVPDGDCTAGYYCPGGDNSTTPTTECAAGQYCPAGSSMATSCPAGTYSDTARASSCTTCPAGKYCPLGTSSIAGTNQDCPVGAYCPSGTKADDEFLCPAGTFVSTTASASVSDCGNCTAGYACENPGVSDPTTAPCDAGFYCLQASTYTTPESATYGGMCAPGQYCPAASPSASP